MSDLTYEYPAAVVMQRARETRAMIEENKRLRAALERIILINGSTGGHKAMVAEFKHIAREALAGLDN